MDRSDLSIGRRRLSGIEYRIFQRFAQHRQSRQVARRNIGVSATRKWIAPPIVGMHLFYQALDAFAFLPEDLAEGLNRAITQLVRAELRELLSFRSSGPARQHISPRV